MSAWLSLPVEIALLALSIVVLILDPFLKTEGRRRSLLGWLGAGGLIVILGIHLWQSAPDQPTLLFGGILVADGMTFWFKAFFLLAAAISAVFFSETKTLQSRAEAYVLLLISTLGMCLLVLAADLIMLYVAIETTSIPLYVLAGFLRGDDKSTEAGFKYLLFGVLTSAILLYGLSLLFGLSGETDLYALRSYVVRFDVVSLGVVLLVLTGLAFKIAIFPFHFWAPDVYEGAPTPVAGFLSTASKAAGFAVLMRLCTTAFPSLGVDWRLLLAILAALTMTVGNLIALTQKNIKRLLAYSSIAHAGYVLLGLVAFSSLGLASLMFYLLVYLLTNLLAFGLVGIVGQVSGSDEMTAYNGLSRRNAALALALLAALLSLAGIPPFGGFVAKFLLFSAAVETGWVWLVLVGVLNSMIGLYYYLNVLKYVYLYRKEGEDEEQHPVPLSRAMAAVLFLLVIGILLLGTVFAPWVNSALSLASTLR